jgi:cell division septum initiation protein DivIVA
MSDSASDRITTRYKQVYKEAKQTEQEIKALETQANKNTKENTR